MFIYYEGLYDFPSVEVMMERMMGIHEEATNDHGDRHLEWGVACEGYTAAKGGGTSD